MKMHAGCTKVESRLCLRRWDPSSADHVPPKSSFQERVEREREREKENFCPSWSLVCIAPRLYSFDQKWRVRSSLSNESFQVDLVQNLMSLRRYRHTSVRMWRIYECTFKFNNSKILTFWRYEKVRFLKVKMRLYKMDFNFDR